MGMCYMLTRSAPSATRLLPRAWNRFDISFWHAPTLPTHYRASRAPSLLAVLKGQIRSSNKIEKEENKHALLIYFIYMNIFPHVLENKCFVGHIYENHRKHAQNAQRNRA